MDSRLLWGILETLILKVLSRGPNYGYEITQLVAEESGDYLELKEGSLYPALHRLERQALLSSYWTETEAGRRRKYYKLTRAGQGELAKKTVEWSRFSAAVNGLLGDSGGLA
ncbi:MAG: PadR family transcriptional regulator [Planctomycetota bacterium]|jgi:transcriptional regulator